MSVPSFRPFCLFSCILTSRWTKSAKLAKIGVNSKMIEVIAELYKNMRIYFDGVSPTNLSRGVLQGDCLSPTLFNLFLSDLELSESQGLSLGCKQRYITHLMFADDLVVVANNLFYLQNNMNIMYKYLMINGLSLNLNKTKKSVFSNHPRRKRNKLYVNGDSIESVNKIKYLGIDFFADMNLTKMINNRVNAGILYFHLIWRPLRKMNYSNIPMAFKLFDAQIVPKVLYGAHMWSAGAGETIERIQTTFIKKLFSLPPQTAGYILRLELMRYQVKVKIFARILRFWNKIVKLPDDRLIKICLVEAMTQVDSPREVSWFKDLSLLFREVGLSVTLAYSLAQLNKLNLPHLIKLYGSILYNKDLYRLKNTHTYGGLNALYPPTHYSSFLLNQLNIIVTSKDWP